MKARVPALCAWLLALAACASFGGVEAPEVYVIDLVPLESNLFEQRLRVDLRIRNPNDYDLNVVGVDFRLDVNGAPLARGISGDEVLIPRFGEAVVSVLASTTVLDLVRQVLALDETEELGYELYGQLYVRKFLRGTIPFQRSATLRGGSGVEDDR